MTDFTEKGIDLIRRIANRDKEQCKLVDRLFDEQEAGRFAKYDVGQLVITDANQIARVEEKYYIATDGWRYTLRYVSSKYLVIFANYAQDQLRAISGVKPCLRIV